MEFYNVKYDVFYESNILLKDDVLKKIANYTEKLGSSANHKKVYDELILRELSGSTIIDDGVAMPHVESDCIIHSSIQIIKLENGVQNWNGCDKPVHLVVALIIKKGDSIEIMKEIQTFVRKLANEQILKDILELDGQEKIIEYIKTI